MQPAILSLLTVLPITYFGAYFALLDRVEIVSEAGGGDRRFGERPPEYWFVAHDMYRIDSDLASSFFAPANFLDRKLMPHRWGPARWPAP